MTHDQPFRCSVDQWAIGGSDPSGRRWSTSSVHSAGPKSAWFGEQAQLVAERNGPLSTAYLRQCRHDILGQGQFIGGILSHAGRASTGPIFQKSHEADLRIRLCPSLLSGRPKAASFSAVATPTYCHPGSSIATGETTPPWCGSGHQRHHRFVWSLPARTQPSFAPAICLIFRRP
jgi:hypothetical protein